MRKVLFLMLFLAVNAVNGVADDTVATENIQSESSLPHVTAEMAVDFPVGNDSQLRRAILGFIFDRCQEIYEGVEVERPSNSCNAKEFKAFLDHYTSTLCRLTAEDRKECADALAEEGETYEADWFSNLYINKTADTELYVSYTTYNTDFSGGGHDNRMSEAVTIRKSDGAVISSIFVEDAEEKMQDVLWKYLIASEEPEDPAEYRAEINRFLEANYGRGNHLMLPTGSIYLAPDGVYILYSAQEICFWPGEPVIVIPYEVAKPFLTKEAAQLLETHP